MPDIEPTADENYTRRLVGLQSKRWKRLFNVQLPWQLHLRSLKLGRTLDVGSGIGRNLVSLGAGSIGVDHNSFSVATANQAGLTSYTVDEFFASKKLAAPHSFDSMLVAHVIEHLSPADAISVIGSYLPMIKPGGRIVWITPQERGFASDATHINFVDFPEQLALAEHFGLEPVKHYSFPFPRFVGKFFTYNETVVISRVPTA